MAEKILTNKADRSLVSEGKPSRGAGQYAAVRGEKCEIGYPKGGMKWA